MKYKRYGDFKARDYFMSWLGIAILVLFSIMCVALKLNIFLIIFPILYSVIWFCTIFLPNFERFTITDDLITVFIVKKCRTISLPTKVTLIVSRADIAPPFTQRTPIGNETHILKDKYAVSILKMMPLNDALAALHQNHIPEYTSSTIRMHFDNSNYIYSFVYDQRLFQKLIASREYQIIIPESVLKEGHLTLNELNMYVDVGH